MQIAQWKMAANGSSARSPGRPRDAALDGAILAAAVRHLGERGYDKLELAVAGIDAMPTGPLPGPAGEPRADALAILENLRASMVMRNAMAILGTILAEHGRNPELLEHFRQRLVEPRRESLRQALSRGVQTGHLRADLDLDVAVSLLIGSLYDRHLRARRIPHDWAERTLRIVWPADPDASG